MTHSKTKDRTVESEPFDTRLGKMIVVKVGAELRCEHVVDFLLPGENGGEYGVVVEEISAAGRC